MDRPNSRPATAEENAILRFRAPATSLAMSDLLQRAVPGASVAQREEGVREGAVAVAGRVWREPSQFVEPGAVVEVSGALCHREGMPEESPTGGPLCALVLAPPWPSGELGRGRAGVRYRVVERRGAVAELKLEASGGVELEPGRVLAALAALGHPAIGDIWNGGVLVAGGLRLAADGAERAPDWWPRESVLLGRGPQSGGQAEPLEISRESERVLQRGHPWVLADADSGDPQCYRPGALVRLEPQPGRAAGLALIDGEGRCVARRWSLGESRPDRIERRIEAAFDRRAELFAAAGTDCFRLVHGEADALPGLAIDRLGPVLRVLISGRTALSIGEPARDAAVRALCARVDIEPVVIEVMHLRRPAGARLECVRCVAGDPAKLGLDGAGRFVVRERGLRFAVDPGLADPWRSAPGVGLFLDQRENRERIAARARAGSQGRWLNLFAHTGAFSVALLEAGAREVTSVDLSARALAWLDHNLELNREGGIDPERHVGVRRDGRRFLAELPRDERFAGIVLDPPTAAAVGRKYWSIRKDLQPLIEKALEHLEPAGWLLVARNDRAGRKGSLRAILASACETVGVRLQAVESAPPAPDFPIDAAFPEGRPFRALLAQRADSS